MVSVSSDFPAQAGPTTRISASSAPANPRPSLAVTAQLSFAWPRSCSSLAPFVVADLGVDGTQTILGDMHILAMDEHRRKVGDGQDVVLVVHLIDPDLVGLRSLFLVELDGASFLRRLDHRVVPVVTIAVEEEVGEIVHVGLCVGWIEAKEGRELALAAHADVKRQR